MNNNFGYEIEFIPVGSGRSGDAILVRYGVQGNYKIICKTKVSSLFIVIVSKLSFI